MDKPAIMITGVFFCALAFYLRVRPRLKQRAFGIDSWYYLLYAKELRKRRKIPAELPYYLLDIDEQWYPPFLPVMLSFLPVKLLERFHWVISPAIDSLQAFVLFLAAYFFTGNILGASVAALFYATSFLLVTQNSNLNTRALGALFFALMALWLCLASYAGPWALLIAALWGVLLLFTHKFSTQQMVFLLTGLAIIRQDARFIALLAVIFILAVVVGKGFYVKILRGHIAILDYWRRNLAFLGAHQVYDSPVYKDSVKAVEKKGCKGIASSKLSLDLARLQFVLIFMAVSLYAFERRGAHSPVDLFFLQWYYIVFFCVIAITYFGPIKFLGEGQRYFMFAVLPASYLLARSLNLNFMTNVLLFSILVINMLLVSVIHRQQKGNILAGLDDDLSGIIKKLRELPENNIMSLPFSYCEPIAYFTGKKTLWGAHSYNYPELEKFFPVFKEPVDFFISKYGINYCLINKNYVSADDLRIGTKFAILIEKPDYLLLEFEK